MLESGYTLRGARPEDVAAAQAVVDAAESALTGERRRGAIDVATAFADPRIDPATGIWVVEAPGGELVGYADLSCGETAQGETEPHVHPSHLGRGVGGALLDAAERRAVELASSGSAEAAPRLHVHCAESRARRRAALLARGFRAVRHTCLMRLDLDETPPRPTPLSEGIEVRTFKPGHDEKAVYVATEEAYAEHFLFRPATMAEWRLEYVDQPRFDPSLWLVAWAGEEVAGETLLFPDESEAYVDSVSVRRPWRRRGLALALLTRALLLAHERGFRKVRLGVDAQNPTGALDLYLKAGMRVERREEVYAKDLRR